MAALYIQFSRVRMIESFSKSIAKQVNFELLTMLKAFVFVLQIKEKLFRISCLICHLDFSGRSRKLNPPKKLTNWCYLHLSSKQIWFDGALAEQNGTTHPLRPRPDLGCQMAGLESELARIRLSRILGKTKNPEPFGKTPPRTLGAALE